MVGEITAQFSEHYRSIAQGLDDFRAFQARTDQSVMDIRIALTAVVQQIKESSDLKTEVSLQGKEIAALKVKCGMWGGLSIIISALASFMVTQITKK